MADRKIAEHAEVEQQLKRPENLVPDDISFEPTTLQEMMSDVRHHVVEEGCGLFPQTAGPYRRRRVPTAGHLRRQVGRSSP